MRARPEEVLTIVAEAASGLTRYLTGGGSNGGS